MAGFFENVRKNLFNPSRNTSNVVSSEENQDYSVVINEIKSADGSIEQTKKNLRNKEKAYSQPVLGMVSMNPEYTRRMGSRGVDLHALLKQYSGNSILNAIINTRKNQVSMYSQPARHTKDGQGFEVRLRDTGDKPNQRERKKIREIEEFIMNTGKKKDVTRDTFNSFLRKSIYDTYVYDQINFEKVFDKNGNLHHFKSVDPATIYFATDDDGKIIHEGYRYVQVIDGVVRARFKEDEMGFYVRNPRSDIYALGYGLSELEITLRNFVSQTNTEIFNDRFFSNGGTTRGVLLIKTGNTQSHQALDTFRREWKNTLSGMNGSWQIPVVNAEDVKFVNMTPTARDMEFEKWLNYNINVICSVFTIDPGEINFPNRGGGATGSGGTSGLSDSSTSKGHGVQSKGLDDLLKEIETCLNQNIISEFGDQYYFQFVGVDADRETEQLDILTTKVTHAMTVNEMREEIGLPGDVIGGDIPLNGVIVQRIGQLMQQEQYEYSKQQDNINRYLDSSLTNQDPSITFQDYQQGLGEMSELADGKDTTGDVGKDGQLKTEPNANSMGTDDK